MLHLRRTCGSAHKPEAAPLTTAAAAAPLPCQAFPCKIPRFGVWLLYMILGLNRGTLGITEVHLT